jgi:hypothetical protein
MSMIGDSGSGVRPAVTIFFGACQRKAGEIGVCRDRGREGSVDVGEVEAPTPVASGWAPGLWAVPQGGWGVTLHRGF